jgi:hypothetical protein
MFIAYFFMFVAACELAGFIAVTLIGSTIYLARGGVHAFAALSRKLA